MPPTVSGVRLASAISLVCLSGVYFLENYDRYLLASSPIPFIDYSSIQYALLSGTMFSLFYTAGGITIALLEDSSECENVTSASRTMLNSRAIVLAVACFIFSIAFAATAAATGFWQLACIRMIMGLSQSVVTPFSTGIISECFDSSHRGIAFGVYNVGLYLAFSLSLSLGTYMYDNYGWRVGYLLFGAIGTCVSVLLPMLIRTPPQPNTGTTVTSGVPASGSSMSTGIQNTSSTCSQDAPQPDSLDPAVLPTLVKGYLPLETSSTERVREASETRFSLGLLPAYCYVRIRVQRAYSTLRKVLRFWWARPSIFWLCAATGIRLGGGFVWSAYTSVFFSELFKGAPVTSANTYCTASFNYSLYDGTTSTTSQVGDDNTFSCSAEYPYCGVDGNCKALHKSPWHNKGMPHVYLEEFMCWVPLLGSALGSLLGGLLSDYISTASNHVTSSSSDANAKNADAADSDADNDNGRAGDSIRRDHANSDDSDIENSFMSQRRNGHHGVWHHHNSGSSSSNSYYQEGLKNEEEEKVEGSALPDEGSKCVVTNPMLHHRTHRHRNNNDVEDTILKSRAASTKTDPHNHYIDAAPNLPPPPLHPRLIDGIDVLEEDYINTKTGGTGSSDSSNCNHNNNQQRQQQQGGRGLRLKSDGTEQEEETMRVTRMMNEITSTKQPAAGHHNNDHPRPRGHHPQQQQQGRQQHHPHHQQQHHRHKHHLQQRQHRRSLLAGLGLFLAVPFVYGALSADYPYCFLSMVGSGVLGEIYFGQGLALLTALTPPQLVVSSTALFLFFVTIIGGNTPLLIPLISPLVSHFITPSTVQFFAAPRIGTVSVAGDGGDESSSAAVIQIEEAHVMQTAHMREEVPAVQASFFADRYNHPRLSLAEELSPLSGPNYFSSSPITTPNQVSYVIWDASAGTLQYTMLFILVIIYVTSGVLFVVAAAPLKRDLEKMVYSED